MVAGQSGKLHTPHTHAGWGVRWGFRRFFLGINHACSEWEDRVWLRCAPRRLSIPPAGANFSLAPSSAGEDHCAITWGIDGARGTLQPAADCIFISFSNILML